MNFKNYLSLITILLVALVSCKKSSTPTPTPPKPTSDVYVAGSIATATGKSVAAYWKNGVVTKLGTDSVNGSYARSIAVKNGDIYVVGLVNNPGNVGTAAYWKNGVLTKLDNSTGINSEAYGIAFQGNDVYIIGYKISDAGYLEGRYWKNGVPTILPSALSASEAIAIKSDGTDIYIAGDTQYDKNNDWVATYWKNGVSPTIVAGTAGKSSEIYSIDVSGIDVYMVGYTNGDISVGIPTYWKNGVATELTDGSSPAGAYGIGVNGSDVIIGGNTTYNGHSVATYWKNGTAVRLGDGSVDSYAGKMAFDNGDTYIVGTSNGSPVFWKNGAMTTLAKKGNGADIVVVPK